MPGARLCTRLSLDDFLSFDGPTGVTVAPDDSRSNFLHHIGLSDQIFRHKMLYSKMKAEAKAGMHRLFEDRKSLEPEYVDDLSVQPPFSVKQISEFAFQRQVVKIYETASTKSRGIYDITWTPTEGNWVIRWMLWRVIQRSQVQSSPAVSSSAATEYSTMSTCGSSAVEGVQTAQTSPFWATNSSITPHDFSDSEDWDDMTKIKVEKDPFPRPTLPPRRSGFWSDVMDTT